MSEIEGIGELRLPDWCAPSNHAQANAHTVMGPKSSAAIALGASGDLFGLAFLLIPPVHMYRQLRGAYALSRPSALWRTAVLLVFATIALGLFATLLLILGVAN